MGVKRASVASILRLRLAMTSALEPNRPLPFAALDHQSCVLPNIILVRVTPIIPGTALAVLLRPNRSDGREGGRAYAYQSCVLSKIMPVRVTPIIPGTAPAVLVSPKRSDACLGDRSA